MPGIKHMAIACQGPDVPACHRLHLLSLSLSVTLPSSCLYFFCLFTYILYAKVFHLHVCICALCASVRCVHKSPQKPEGVTRSPGTESYRYCWATVWMLGIEPRSPVRGTSALPIEPPLQPPLQS